MRGGVSGTLIKFDSEEAYSPRAWGAVFLRVEAMERIISAIFPHVRGGCFIKKEAEVFIRDLDIPHVRWGCFIQDQMIPPGRWDIPTCVVGVCLSSEGGGHAWGFKYIPHVRGGVSQKQN